MGEIEKVSKLIGDTYDAALDPRYGRACLKAPAPMSRRYRVEYLLLALFREVRTSPAIGAVIQKCQSIPNL